MNWDELLSGSRFSSEAISPSNEDRDESHLTVFQKDAQRVLYSTPFRRMQGKTQVHPFPSTDYLRTRLTHTVEVAHVGRTIASEIGRCLNKNAVEFGDILYAASLAHDIGNPPFGHVGEYAIRSWFEDCNNDKFPTIKEVLSEGDVRNDFLHFDGNAQGFRIVTRLTGWRDRGGLQLSHATMGAFSKYPYASKYSSPDKMKFGFMSCEGQYAKKVFTAMGLQSKKEDLYKRHPFAMILEAADDICYLTTDIEDAFRTGHLAFTQAESLLECFCKKGDTMRRYQSMSNIEQQDKIAYLRSGAISALIVEAVNQFVGRENEILKGNFSASLIEADLFKEDVKNIRNECRKNVYNERKKLETEAAGINVILSLMRDFGGMIDRYKTNSDEKTLSIRDKHFLYLLPVYTREKLARASKYESLLLLVDYISGMTDRFALDLSMKLNGSSPTIGRMI